MAFAAVYQQFLAAPDPSQLAENATLNYITTTTSFKGSSNIIQHLNTLRKQVKKKKEHVISLVHGQDAIATEIETEIEFVTSGASYLPALDDNFLADRTVNLPIMHIVSFDHDGKIVNIRQSWDQGALLKQLDVIGRTGRNWPIRDSKDQIKMIENCVKATVATSSATSQPPTTIPDRSRGNSANALRDPHASLSLFESREEREQGLASVISPKGGARPRQRGLSEILGDEPDDAPDSPSAGRHRSISPSKAVAPRGGPRPRQRGFDEIFGDGSANGHGSSETARGRSNGPNDVISPKAGANKKFQPSRLFEIDETANQDQSLEDVASPPVHPYRPNPKKYNHFEFGDGSDPQDVPKPSEPSTRNPKHNSQWSFDDFSTPAKFKPGRTLRHQEAHQPEDDEPVKMHAQGKSRREAEHHFEFADDGNSPDRRPVRPRGSKHDNGLGLYENNLYDEKTPTSTDRQQPLGAITNLKDRGREFDAHWSNNPTPNKLETKATVSDDRLKSVKMMESNWSAGEESPAQKENQRAVPRNGSNTVQNRGIAIAGDGMGGNKGSSRDIALGGDGMGGKPTASRGIAIGGDGMGGNKGSSRNWFFSDEDDEPVSKPVPGRQQPPAKTGGFNWDF